MVRRSTDTSAVLDQFIIDVGQAAMTGDVIGVVLRHARSLLGAEFARLVLDDATGGRCWLLEGERVLMQPLDAVDRALWSAGAGAGGLPVAHEVDVDGTTAQALVSVRKRADDETLMLAVGRTGRRTFEERSERLFQSIFTFADVALQNMWLLNRVQEKAAALEHLANHDALTVLANRLRFQEEAATALANGTATTILGQGGKSWFFITADYAFGTQLQAAATKVVKSDGEWSGDEFVKQSDALSRG